MYEATEMNDLPTELLLSIFKCLKIKERAPCRLVCKKFLSICEEIKVTELIISSTIENVRDYWFPTNELFNHKDAINVATFMACRSKFQPEKFLKRLHFKGTYGDYQRLNVNGLTHIEQLTIDIVHERHRQHPVIDIDLPNLKILHDRSGFLFVLRLNTPKLNMLKCEDWYFTPIHFNHPDTITHLELGNYFETAVSLKNIKYLRVKKGFENIRSANHPKLEHLVCNYLFADESIDEENVISMNAIRKLVEQKRRPLRVYFQSVELENVEKIDEYDRDNHLAFQIHNYNSLLGNNIFCYDIQYNELMEMVNGNLPNDFYQKYFRVRSVSVTGNVKDESHFIGFLKSMENLDSIWLNNSAFDQSFYDFLPEFDQLTCIGLEKMSKPITSFDFLFKLPRLQQFITEQDSILFFDLAVALFRQLKCFDYIGFCYEEDFLSIYKHSSTNYFFRQQVDENGTKATIFDQRDISELSQFFSWFIDSK